MITNDEWFTNPDRITIIILACVILLQFAFVIKIQGAFNKCKCLASSYMLKNSELQQKVKSLEEAMASEDSSISRLKSKISCYAMCIDKLNIAIHELGKELTNFKKP